MKKNPPRRQHWLPCVYLKEFSPDPSKGRRSKVWRFDGSGSICVPVDSQCREIFFYSGTSPHEAEGHFEDIEALYSGCMKKIKAGPGPRPTSSEYFGLIVMVLVLHLRNKAQQNLSGQNNFGAYRTRIFLFLRHMLLGRSYGTEAEVKSHLHKHWRVRIIRPSGGSEFMTSDNPTMIFSTNNKHECHFTILPITPDHLAVAFDRRFVRVVSGQTSQADDEMLNRNQCRQALQCVYSRIPLDDEQEGVVSKLLKEPRNHGVLRRSAVEFVGMTMTSESPFSFIETAIRVT